MATTKNILSFEASKAIEVSRFIKFTDGKTVEAATSSTDKIIGVSDTVNYEAGDFADVYLIGEKVYLTAGATVSAGDALTSDSQGRGIIATSGNYGAIALEDGAQGDMIRVLVVISRAQEQTEAQQNTSKDNNG